MRPADVQRVTTDLYVVVGVALDAGPMTRPTHHMRIEKRGSRWYLEVSSGQRSIHPTLRAARLAASQHEATSDRGPGHRVPGYSNFGGGGPFAPMGSPKKEMP
jgi:hypothetical protein